MDRDRDEFGRPRNARARDALGRPLPPGALGEPRIPDDLSLPPADTVAYARDLLSRGQTFHAHEVFEAAWKNGPDDERPLWQGLAQFAVGLTHIQRGNRTGAAAVLRRASALLADVPGAPYGIDIIGLTATGAALVNDLTAGVEIDPEQLRPRLTR